MGILNFGITKPDQVQQKRESVFQFTSDKLVFKSVMPAGNFTVWNTVSNQTVKCHLTRPSVVAMIHSTPSSPKLGPANTSHVPSSLIWNQLLLMKSVLVLTDNSSIQNSLSLVKKMPPITTPEVTTPLVRKSSTLSSTESENWLINVPVSKVSSSSTHSVVVPVPVSLPS